MKNFLIIGNKNAAILKDIFPLLINNKVWFGVTSISTFTQSDGTLKKFGNVGWLTNMDHKLRPKPLKLAQKYTPEKYPKYDNYDAIECSKTKDIPYDYDGVIGVPVSFIDKYCSEQFEIIGKCENLDLYKLKTKVYSSKECKQAYFDKFGKKGVYDLNASGVLIKNGIKEKVFSRILIKRKL